MGDMDLLCDISQLEPFNFTIVYNPETGLYDLVETENRKKVEVEL